MANKSPETPTPPAFLTDGLSLEDQNTPILSVLTCRSAESGKDCIICHLQSYLRKDSSRIKVSLGATAKGAAGIYYNMYSIGEKRFYQAVSYVDMWKARL